MQDMAGVGGKAQRGAINYVDTEPRSLADRRDQLSEFFAIHVSIAVLVIVREECLVLLGLFCAARRSPDQRVFTKGGGGEGPKKDAKDQDDEGFDACKENVTAGIALLHAGHSATTPS